MLVLNLPAFEKKNTEPMTVAGPYGEILTKTKKEPIRTLGFTFPCNKAEYWPFLNVYGPRLRLDP